MLKMDVIIQQKPCLHNMEIPGGEGGSSKTSLERKFLRVGGCKLKNLLWEGYGYFLEPHIPLVLVGKGVKSVRIRRREWLEEGKLT